MVTKVLSAFFTNNGVPQTGLSPTIDIWQIIVSPFSTPQIVFSAPLVEVGGGWYVYLFASYTFDFNYLFTVDGTATLTGSDRYKFGGNESYEEEVSDEGEAVRVGRDCHDCSGTDGIRGRRVGWSGEEDHSL